MTRSHKEMIGKSSAHSQALEHLSQLAPINRPALIIGERGTGKELACERLHFLSERWQQPLIKVNCAALSNELLESELFGHEQGAFTGASSSRQGRFERADGGSLFLDEVATMSTQVQEKLLRLIEYGEFERLGGQRTLQVDMRIIAATNADLPALSQQGKFRDDLLDRLSFDVVNLPPLRYRMEDIAPLAEHFAIQMCRDLDWDFFPGFSVNAMTQLHDHHWPGNIRELKNVVERSVYRWAKPNSPVATIIIDPFASPYLVDQIAPPPDMTQPATASPATNANSKPTQPQQSQGFTDAVQGFERQTLQRALRENQSHQGRTAKALQLSYHQLRGLLRKHQLSGQTD